MSKQSRARQKRQTSVSKNKGKFWNSYYLISGGIFLFLAVASIAALQLTRQHKSLASPNLSDHKATAEEKALSDKTEFGQFPPYTDAERELEKMLHTNDDKIDLALAAWLIVADIPEFRDLTYEAYLSRLDDMTEQVRNDMAKMQANGWHGTDPNYPPTRCTRFCSAIISLRFSYAEEFREENLTPQQMRAMYNDPDNIFLAGLLRTKNGSCVSLPQIYLIIGRRLGLPVHLVAIGKHYFIRWEEPRYRMNIETTSTEKIAVTPDESVYLDAEGMTRDQLKGSDLRNLTSREVVGELFYTRSSYWHTKDGKCETQSCLDLSRAHYLAPDDPSIDLLYHSTFSFYGIKPEYKSIEIRPRKAAVKTPEK